MHEPTGIENIICVASESKKKRDKTGEKTRKSTTC